MAKPGETGIKRIVSAFYNSLRGFRDSWKFEAAFRQELMLCVVLVPLGFYLGENGVEKALLIGICFLVLIVEILNSSIEAAIDRIGHEEHDLSRIAKDMGSAAVLIALTLVGITWVLVLFF